MWIVQTLVSPKVEDGQVGKLADEREGLCETSQPAIYAFQKDPGGSQGPLLSSLRCQLLLQTVPPSCMIASELAAGTSQLTSQRRLERLRS